MPLHQAPRPPNNAIRGVSSPHRRLCLLPRLFFSLFNNTRSTLASLGGPDCRSGRTSKTASPVTWPAVIRTPMGRLFSWAFFPTTSSPPSIHATVVSSPFPPTGTRYSLGRCSGSPPLVLHSVICRNGFRASSQGWLAGWLGWAGLANWTLLSPPPGE